MDPSIQDLITQLSNARINLEYQVIQLTRELNDLKAKQAGDREGSSKAPSGE